MNTETIIRTHKRFKEKGYANWYWAIDVHDVIFKGNYKRDSDLTWVPNAKRALKIMATIPEIKVILWTSSHEDEIKRIVNKIETETGLKIFSVNGNPDFSKDDLCNFYDKFCFDILLDDKAGFNYYNGWEQVIETLIDLGYGLPKFELDTPIGENKWINLKCRKMSFGGKTYDYIYSHETRCAGNIIIVLPTRKNIKGEIEYLLIREHNPLFGYNYTVITRGAEGTLEKDIRLQAEKELYEEAGFVLGVRLVDTLTSIKSSDTKYWIFTAIADGALPNSVEGDGSIDELFTVKKWVDKSAAIKLLKDPIALAALTKVSYEHLRY